MARRTLEERFWTKVDKHGPWFVTQHPRRRSRCWVWTACQHERGYGTIKQGGIDRKAHRIAYEMAYGPIPSGTEIDHRCRNTPCVRHDHLEAVTHRANVLRGEGVAAKWARRTHCGKGHSLVDAYVRNDGGRRCRECVRLKDRK